MWPFSWFHSFQLKKLLPVLPQISFLLPYNNCPKLLKKGPGMQFKFPEKRIICIQSWTSLHIKPADLSSLTPLLSAFFLLIQPPSAVPSSSPVAQATIMGRPSRRCSPPVGKWLAAAVAAVMPHCQTGSAVACRARSTPHPDAASPTMTCTMLD